MVDLDSQYVRGPLSNALTRFLTGDMVDLDTQPVRGLLSNALTRFLTCHGGSGLSACACLPQIYSLNV